jgi:XTP/dITP diphosphohydrolase
VPASDRAAWTGRVVVTTARHAAAGQLTWAAWDALRSGRVRVASSSRHLPALASAGLDVAPYDDGLPEPVDGDVLLVEGEPPPGAHVVVGSTEPEGSRLLDAVAVMDRLRSPGGCPWDARQTHASLAPYLLEEAYELLDAIESGSREHLREELGDVLLQVLFHARLAEEDAAQPWSVDDVAGDLVDKLVRRHPHVFAGAIADDLEGTWDALKAAEKGRTSVTEGVPLGQPALSLAAKLQKRAERLGAPLPSYDGEGGALWAAVRACREAGLDPEVELRSVARAFRDRLAEVEGELVAQGRATASLTPEEWQAALAP